MWLMTSLLLSLPFLLAVGATTEDDGRCRGEGVKDAVAGEDTGFDCATGLKRTAELVITAPLLEGRSDGL